MLIIDSVTGCEELHWNFGNSESCLTVTFESHNQAQKMTMTDVFFTAA